MPSPRLTASCFVLCASWASPAAAQPASWSLSWTAPPECPGEPSLRAQVESMVGRRESPVRMTARVSPDASGRWRAALTTEARGAQGARSIEAATCRELADAVAVILAWMIDPSAQPPPPEAHVTPGADVTPPAAAPVDATPAATPAVAAPAPPARRTEPALAMMRVRAVYLWRARVAVGARGDLGALPAFAAGPSLRVSLARGAQRLFVDASWRPTVRYERSSSPSYGGEFDLWTAGLGACHRWFARPVSPALCAGFEAGALSARGFGVTRPGSDTEPWAAAWAGGALELPVLSWLTLTARAAATVPVVRPNFVLVGVGEVFQPAAVGLRTAIDAEVTF